ncbi:hypothetical protein MG293_007135 [Ovis ammon polii]|uniref:Uncharacterized protein n=1 Tax=Ovis ammon polii TaxID=230172 RepID=A0AAD4YCK8_OVIAM|nr:hypothetical protein MG293_007135 [Ovis ammon polii]KAI4572465.1 hypothetical protein MJT46_005533 [Ovis ammon polii x Ovis aries]
MSYKLEQIESFNGENSSAVPESGDLDNDSEAILAADFEIGHFLREPIIPRSVLYFTGEAIEDDDDDYDESEEADKVTGQAVIILSYKEEKDNGELNNFSVTLDASGVLDGCDILV